MIEMRESLPLIWRLCWWIAQ